MKKLINKLYNAQSKYDGQVGSVESEIADKVEFDFGILWQQADGWVMVAFDGCNSPIEPLLEIIKNKGSLNKDDYMTLSI